MKAFIYGNDFKSGVERVSATIMKSGLPFMNTVQIVCDGKEARISTMNQDTLTTVKIYADVVDSGTCVVDYDVLKKICGVTGDITIEYINGKFSVHSRKKHYEVSAMYCDDDVESFQKTFKTKEKNHLVMSCPDHVLLRRISALDCMRGKDYNTLMRGFNIDVSTKRISAIDGHRVGIGYIPDEYALDSGKFTVQGNFYKILKSILRGTNENNIVDIYTGEKFTYFIGTDYEISMRNIEGVWFDIDSIVRPVSTTDFSFTADPNELGKITKEYTSIAGSDKDTPMVLYTTGEDLVTAFVHGDYKTADIVEKYNPIEKYLPDNEWWRGLKPSYVRDACNMFTGEVKISGNFDHRTPITLSNSDDEYLVLILPVNISSSDNPIIDYARSVLS